MMPSNGKALSLSKHKISRFSKDAPEKTKTHSKPLETDSSEEEDDSDQNVEERDSSDNDPNKEFEVEKILSDSSDEDGFWKFRIHWKGFSSKHDSWSFDDDMACEDKLAEYWKTRPERHKKYNEAKKARDKKLERYKVRYIDKMNEKQAEEDRKRVKRRARKRIEKQKRLEEQERLEEQKRLEERKRMEERKRIKNQKRLEEQKRVEEQKRLEEQKRIEEQKRLEEKKRLEEQNRLAEQRRTEKQKQLEEQKRFEEEKKAAQLKEQGKIERTENERKRRAELDAENARQIAITKRIKTCQVERSTVAVDPRLNSAAQRDNALAAGLKPLESPPSVAGDQPVMPTPSPLLTTSNRATESVDPTRLTVEKIIGRGSGKNGYRGYVVKFTDRPNASHVEESYMERHYLNDVVKYFVDKMGPSVPTEFGHKSSHPSRSAGV